MSGLVGVIAYPGAPPVREAEIDALAADYAALRGKELPRTVCGDDRARVVAYADAVDVPVPTRPAPDWLATAGTMRPVRPWTRGTIQELGDTEGQFALVARDAERRETVIANDPFGMYGLFVSEGEGRLYVSTSALALARHRRPIASATGILTFLLLGYQFGPTTHWPDIRRLEPGTAIAVSETSVLEEQYWRPEVDRRIAGLGMKPLVDEALDASVEACRAHLAGEGVPWADLTGGMDSRLLCLLLEAANVPFRTNTRETRMPGDLELARRVAETAGWTWRYPELPGDWPALLPARLPESLAWGDGQLEVLQLARVLWAHERLAEDGRTLLSGGGGEHFQFWAWQSELLKAGRSKNPNLERWVDLQLLKPVTSTMLAANARETVRSHLLSLLRRRVEPYRDERNTTQLDALFAYRSTGHFGAYRSADGAHLRAILPFYLRPVFSVAFSADYRLRNGHELMKHMIHRLNPAIAAIPTTRGGPALPWRPWRIHRFLPYYAVLGRKGINKIAGRTLGRIIFPAQGDYEWQSEANGNVLASLADQGVLDRSRMRLAPLLDPAAFDGFVAGAAAPGFGGTLMLGRLLTAELALRATDTDLS